MAFPLKVKRGATFDRTLTWWTVQNVTPRNLTGYTMRMQVRLNPGQPALIDVAIGTGITLVDAVNGKFRIVVTAATTTALAFTGKAKYDLQVTDAGGAVSYPLYGDFVISDPVTV